MENEQNITLNLSVNEANIVMSALQELPFRVSHTLIKKIQEQGEAQLQPQTEEEEKK